MVVVLVDVFVALLGKGDDGKANEEQAMRAMIITEEKVMVKGGCWKLFGKRKLEIDVGK